ncbi:MAG: formate dehydrogenase accessory sulfurtransferase FdhD [Chloroflexota bacterium]
MMDTHLKPFTPTPTVRRSFTRYQASAPVSVEEDVIGEIRFTVFLDGRELVTFMCSPWKLRELVLGFLYLEGLIECLEDVSLLRICPEDRLGEVQLRAPVQIPERKILTSGCSGGMSFGKYLEDIQAFRLTDSDSVTPQTVYDTMLALYRHASLYHRARGVHTSVLARKDGSLIVAEDIGRHNTLDKLKGHCLVEGASTQGALLISSGRISSEMLLKSAVMGIPVVGSRTSPTDLAVTLAEQLNITVIGYIRPTSMNVYCHPWRLDTTPTRMTDLLGDSAPFPTGLQQTARFV